MEKDREEEEGKKIVKKRRGKGKGGKREGRLERKRKNHFTHRDFHASASSDS